MRCGRPFRRASRGHHRRRHRTGAGRPGSSPMPWVFRWTSPRPTEVGALGAALVAGVGIGAYARRSRMRCGRPAAPPGAHDAPDPERHSSARRSATERYLALAEALRPLLEPRDEAHGRRRMRVPASSGRRDAGYSKLSARPAATVDIEVRIPGCHLRLPTPTAPRRSARLRADPDPVGARSSGAGSTAPAPFATSRSRASTASSSIKDGLVRRDERRAVAADPRRPQISRDRRVPARGRVDPRAQPPAAQTRAPPRQNRCRPSCRSTSTRRRDRDRR